LSQHDISTYEPFIIFIDEQYLVILSFYCLCMTVIFLSVRFLQVHSEFWMICLLKELKYLHEAAFYLVEDGVSKRKLKFIDYCIKDINFNTEASRVAVD